MAWAAEVPSAQASLYREAKHSALLASVDSEDQFANVDQYLSILNQLDFPATFFVVSELFKDYPKMLESMSENIEIASHSENHNSFLGVNAKEQFERIQSSRLEIEETAHSHVNGFRPPEEKFDENTVNAALQNNLDYFAGNAKFERLAPTLVANGKMLYFSRTIADDFTTLKSIAISNDADIINNFLKEADRVQKAHGAFFLNMHTHVFGQAKYKKTLQALFIKLNQKNFWKTNYESLTQWWRERDAISAKIMPVEIRKKNFLLVIENKSKNEIVDFDIDLDLGAHHIRKIETSLRSPSTATSLSPLANPIENSLGPEETNAKIHIEKIAPLEKMELKIEVL